MRQTAKLQHLQTTRNFSSLRRCLLGGTSDTPFLRDRNHPAAAERENPVPCAEADGIASDIRLGAAWFVLPLAAASLARLALERQYLSLSYLAWLLALVAYAAVMRQILRSPAPSRIRLALLANFAAIGVGYAMIGAALGSANGWRADDLLYRAENLIFGRDPQQFLVPWHTPWVSTMAILGYVSFVGFLIYLFLAEGITLSRKTGRLQLGLMRLYGIGYSGYILFPAAGPLFRQHGILDPSMQSSVSAYLDPWVVRFCSHVDAWPSLHAAVCCFALIWTFQHHRRVFYLLIVPSAALMLGAVYFQFHYFIDLLAGCLLGAVCLLPVFQDGLGKPAPKV